MLDLKYLTVADLERFAKNLKDSIDFYEKNNAGLLSDNKSALLKEWKEELHQVEIEILERTLLGKTNEGGATT